MYIESSKTYLSATDISTYIACPHATWLNLQVQRGAIEKAPIYYNATLKALIEKGEAFEAGYIEALKQSNKTIIAFDSQPGKGKAGGGNGSAKAMDTITAMKQGADIIYQARLEHGIWNGRADFLRRVEAPSKLGSWSYEVIDTKLSKTTKAGAILQICLYSEILCELQGIMPEHMYIMNPNGEETYRVDDYKLDQDQC